MIKTMSVQSVSFSDPSPYLLLEAIDNIIAYLNHDIIMDGEHAFFDRKDITVSISPDGPTRNKQYYVNGILISGLLENLDNEKFSMVQKRFDDLIETICSLMVKKLKSADIFSSHEVFVDRDDDYGDIVIGFWKKGSD